MMFTLAALLESFAQGAMLAVSIYYVWKGKNK